MADETFGVSIVEAQASGLPVVGVEAGAMVDRVTDEIGRLGPVDDSDAMAANILSMWNADRDRISVIAQAEARQYSWDSSMAALFGIVYREASRTAASVRCIRVKSRVRPTRAFRPNSAPSPAGSSVAGRDVDDAPYELLEKLEPGIARVLAHNPSPFTFNGTQTY